MNPPSRPRILRSAGWILVAIAVLVVGSRLWMRVNNAGADFSNPAATTSDSDSPAQSPSGPSAPATPAASTGAAPLPSKYVAPPGRTAPAHPAAAPAAVADARPLEKLLAGDPFSLLDHGHPVSFELALDELYLPAAPVGRRLRQVARQPDAASLLRLSASLGATESTVPNLVIYPAGQPRNDSTRRIITDRLLLRIAESAAAEQIADAADLRITARPEYAPGYVVAEARTTGTASGLGALARLEGRQGVLSASLLLARMEAKKATIPNDTLFSQQWHLLNTGQGGGTAGADAAVTTAWDNYQGSGITIVVVDDGVQLTHPDLAPNADSTHHFDWNDSPHDTDPTPDPANQDFHGTSVAGVAAARGGNILGVSGAAPQAKIVGFRLIAGAITDQDEADAMSLHNSIVQVKSNSWGTPDDEPWVLGEVGPLFLDALENGVTTGRGGKGIIYVWAAGNGRANGDQANKDGYDNSIYVLPVGALTNTGTLSSYSETGSNLVVSAPSSGGTLGIVTTDLVGNDGYNTNSTSGNLADRNYTNNFGGTSSATPLVSGVVALMLQANPNLSWRDVKEILLRSSTKISPTDTGWVSRVAGDPALPPIQHNEKFGGGRINAQAAVALAASWPARAPMVQFVDSHNYGVPGISIPDNNTVGIETSFVMSAHPAMRIEHVEVTISASHTYRGDLQITLTSPAGVVSTLASVTGADNDFGAVQRYDGWTFSTVRHWGESSLGVWKVTVKDLAAGDVGNLESVAIRFSGISAPLQDIAVEQPAGTNLVAGVTGTDFGNVATDNPASKTFTLKNVGDFPLTSIAASIDGPDAPDFSLTAPLPTSLGASGSTTFTVRFAPSTTGPKQAVLHIASNDPDESPFDIPLAGTATPSVGFLALDAPAYTVNETDGTVTISVTRTGGSFGTVTASVSTTNGTAIAPGDFTALTNVPVTIPDGAFSGSTTVAIVNTGTAEANETFTVTLSNPTNGARLGTPVQAPVTIIDSTSLSKTTDLTAPAAPMITAPAANALVGIAAGGTVGINGSATDNKGVKQVLVALNGGAFTDAVLGTPGAPSTTFSATLTPLTGSNTLQVQSVDYSGRVSSIVTRVFKVARLLAVNVDTTLGSLTAGFSPTSFREVGQMFFITATPKPPTTTPAFAGANFTGWTLGGLDVANGGAPFTPQRLGLASTALEKPTLSFIFREGLVLTANFVLNPFAPVAGTYNGLVHASITLPDRPGLQTDGTARSNSTEGYFSATVTNTGAFSGTLTIDGSALAVAGAFDLNGVARFGISRATTLAVARLNKPSLLVAFTLDLDPARQKDTISGSVTATGFQRSMILAVSNLKADRAFYDGLTPATTVPAAYLGAANATQSYTVVFHARQPFQTLDVAVDGTLDQITAGSGLAIGDRVAFADPAPVPPKTYQVFTVVDNDDASPGDGVFKLHDSNDNLVNIDDGLIGTSTLVLDPENHQIENLGLTTQDYPQGDGYAFLTITKAGLVTITTGKLADGSVVTGSSKLTRENKFPLFAQLYNKLGYLSGDVALDSTKLESDLASTNLDWLRPRDFTSQYYPNGWEQIIRVGFQGARYAASFTPAGNVLRIPDGPDGDLTGDALLPADAINGNAALNFTEGQLTGEMNRLVSISTTNVITKVPATDTTFALTLTAATGLFSGTFVHENDEGVAAPPTTSYEGAIYQKGAHAGGFGFFLTRKPAPIDYTGQSGAVHLTGFTGP